MAGRRSNRPSSTLIGVDVGSTHVKAALLMRGSGLVHVARRVTPTNAVRGGAWLDPEELLGAVESAIAECVAASAGGARSAEGADARAANGAAATGTPLAIGIASMAEAGVPLDGRGRPTGRIMAWYDARPTPQAEWLESRIGAPGLFARTGLRPEAKYTLPKLLWLREHESRAMARMRSWAGVAELVAHRLTGNLATNASLACRTAAFDVAARRWDAELLGLAGVSPEQMPAVLPLGRATGGLTAAAAARLGLPAGTPVAIAGHDHMAGALGASVVRPGEALDSIGSAEVVAVVTAAPVLGDQGRRSGFSCGCHALDGTWYLAGGLQSAGALVEWFVNRFLGQMSDEARYPAFLELLGRAGSNPAGPIVRPYLRGLTAPRRDPSARLEILGLNERHGLPEIAAAMIDAAAFHVRWMLEALEAETATSPGRVRATGGGTLNPRWLTAKAALGPGRLEVVQTAEAAALGAALAAGVAGGLYGSIAEALGDAASSTRVAVPNGLRTSYAAAYRRWLPEG